MPKKVVVVYQSPTKRTVASMTRALQITLLGAIGTTFLPLVADYLTHADYSQATTQRFLVALLMAVITTCGIGIKKYIEILQEADTEDSPEVLAPAPRIEATTPVN